MTNICAIVELEANVQGLQTCHIRQTQFLNSIMYRSNIPFSAHAQTALNELVLGRTQFVGSKFGWVHNSILVDKPGFRRVRSPVFPNLGLGLGGFKVRFWWINYCSSKFYTWPVIFGFDPSLK